MNKRTLISHTPEKIDQEVTVSGWVHNRRDHGKLIFLDIRDHTGLIQVVVNPQVSEDAHKTANDLRSEYVVNIRGKVNKRPEKLINKDLVTGTVELEAAFIEILDTADTPPMDLGTEGYEIGEEVRLKFRYLDLRRERLLRNLQMRHKINLFLRNHLSSQDFTEIETPYLSKSTPEGARDYVVPSRQQKGSFYALPQSPQQYKQLLMIGGLDSYFQIVRCFRDEDTRGDRQPEFTQLDIEKSFTNKEEILQLIEQTMIKMVEELLPDKKIKTTPFPRLTYAEAMEKYNTDRPDLRDNKDSKDELAFAFVVDFPMFDEKEDGSLGATHHPFTLPTYDTSLDPSLLRHTTQEGKKVMEMLDKRETAVQLKAFQYDLVCNGYEVGGGSIRTFDKEMLKATFAALGHNEEEFKQKFGHLYEAFGYGVPPHGGIALGLDRLYSIIANEPNIREVIAFPKTGDGRDLMMEAPSSIDESQLKELNLEIKKEQNK